jgi:ribosomal protein L6P/L9E
MLFFNNFYSKALIIRGIGYQADILENNNFNHEFNYSNYLLLRTGHSFQLNKAFITNLGIKVSYKNRKIVIYSSNKNQMSNYLKNIFLTRKPSTYTGRGIRIKKLYCRRKVGKKDKKGKL